MNDERIDYGEIMEELAGGGEQVRVFHVPQHSHQQDIQGRVRLEIDFPSPAALLEWLDSGRGRDLPGDAAVFSLDDLDDVVGSNNTFILKREGARPDAFRLKVRTTADDNV